jgi:putative colanic acid biosynthesis UDP-glucose lipid carrier transferase
MTATQIGRYSKYIRPISILQMCCLLASIVFFWFRYTGLEQFYGGSYLDWWFILAYMVGFIRYIVLQHP